MKNKAIKAIQTNVAGNLKHEGIRPSKAAIDINKQYLKGNITNKQAVSRIKKLYQGGGK